MRHARAERTFVRVGAALFGLLLLATSCDGPNRFQATPVEPDPEPELSEPPVLEIQQPLADPLLQVVVRDSVYVQVRAADDVGLSSLTLSGFAVRGDPLLGTQEIVQRFESRAIDFLASDSLASVTDTIITRYLRSSADVTEERAFIVAETRDLDGFAAADTVEVEFYVPAVIPPSITIELPRGDSLSAKPLGDSVLVRARATDDVGIDSIRFSGLSFRGNADLGTDTVVTRFFSKVVTLDAATDPDAFVTDTTVMRYLNATADTVRETAYIVAQAWDAEGLSSADTVALVLGGPDVELLNVVTGQSVQAGLNFNLGVRARDPQGVSRVDIKISGTIDTVFTRSIVPSADSVQFDTVLAIPPDLSGGTLTVSATARNALDVSGQDGPIAVSIIPVAAGDTIRPTVNISAQTLARYELTDSIKATVTGRDDNQGSGVVRVGVTARAISQSLGDTVTKIFENTFAPVTGAVTRTFAFQTFNVDALSLPDTVLYELTGYMVDNQGNCSASDLETGASVTCRIVGDTVFATDRAGLRVTAGHVSGRTVKLPRGGVIGDAVMDTMRGNLFLSSPSGGNVEVFRLGTQSFGAPISAGFEPWGLALTNDGDSLWVANSTSTDFSVIDLTTEREVDDNRFFTPDVILFDIEVQESDAGVRFLTYFYPQADGSGFTDEPQFVAVDRFGNLVYSTVVNPTGPLGTARKAYFPAGADASEVKLFTEHGGTSQSENFWAVANVDGVTVTNRTETTTDSAGNEIESLISELTIFDHLPGFPDSVITGSADLSQGELPGVAASRARNAGSDVTIYEAARWDITSLGFGDTTYVAASGDGNWVAVGEGARDPAARVLMYQAAALDTTNLSGVIPVTDFLTNTSERVRGVAVNYDGTLALARGEGLYFFDERLRKRGEIDIPGAGASSGAVFHPLHANVRGQQNQAGTYNANVQIAFVGTGQQTIEVVDTWRGSVIGEITIRDNLIGPLRAVLPFAGQNDAYTCASTPVVARNPTGAGTVAIGNAIQLYAGSSDASPLPPTGTTDDACVVVNLYGVTDAGGVVVIPVRKADILRKRREADGG